MLYLSMKDTEEEQLCAEENCVDKKRTLYFNFVQIKDGF